ncbi:MAG TPA: hypothetical protein VMD08_03840 [Candidatus Baltobacteraceae bacterium]|nr:hypothetical protein [Candidatus Baltobacteraceae bacterium]
MAALGTTIEQLFLWSVAGTLVTGALTPAVQAETNLANSLAPVVPLSPADVADAVLRNVDVPGGPEAEAAMSGVNADRLAVLNALAGNAPDPGSLAIALRRKLIDQGTYDRGIRQGRLRDEWGPLVRELAVVQPSPQAMLDAYLEGQISEAEARDRYAQLGGDPAYFDILFDTQGQAPTPTQLADLANRGIIGWGGSGPGVVSFEQGFLEGPWRNKWLGPMREAAAYLPPPRTVTAMHKEGALSDAQATALLEKQGLTPELAAAYLASSSHGKTARAKELAESTVLGLYRDRIIPRAEAATFLDKLGFTPEQADYILQVEDLRVAERYITAAVSRVHTLYVGHKISEAQALAALAGVGVENTQAGELVKLWGHERAANMRELTPAQVESAFGYGIIDQPTALAMLADMGYSPYDAWVALSVHNKAPLANPPAGATVPAPAGP